MPPGISGALLSSVLAVVHPADTQVAYVSAEPARQFAYLLDSSGRRAFATADPAESGAFVAVLYVGGSLLVARAHYPVPRELTQKIQNRRYYDVFLDLRGTPSPFGKVFIVDAGADGVLSSHPGVTEVDTFRDTRETRFNGDLAAQNLTTSGYDARLALADATYARLLNVLIAAIKGSHEARRTSTSPRDRLRIRSTRD